jgi:hypothetical protein
MPPASVIIRPLQNDVPTIELALGNSRSNTSARLKRLLARSDQLIVRVAKADADFLSASGWPASPCGRKTNLLTQCAIFSLAVHSGRIFRAIIKKGPEMGHVLAKPRQTRFFL